MFHFRGGTGSTTIILSKEGKILSRSTGLDTNHWVGVNCMCVYVFLVSSVIYTFKFTCLPFLLCGSLYIIILLHYTLRIMQFALPLIPVIVQDYRGHSVGSINYTLIQYFDI